MHGENQSPIARARISSLHIRNFRVLKDVRLENLTSTTVLLGPNGSGKSTVLDALAFLADAFTVNLEFAWNSRNRISPLRSQNSRGPITITMQYREFSWAPLITYHLEVDEDPSRGPIVKREKLLWDHENRPFAFLDFQEGKGTFVAGDTLNSEAGRIEEQLDSPSLLAVNTLGSFTKHPRVSVLRRFISDWHVSRLHAANLSSIDGSILPRKYVPSGGNLANAIQNLAKNHQDRLANIQRTMSELIPWLEQVESAVTIDGRLLLQIKDAKFDQPVSAQFSSEGALQLLAYMVLLHDPNPPPLVGIEDPEVFLHHSLLPILAEQLQSVSSRMQVVVTTHSPLFVNNFETDNVWVLDRNDDGYTRIRRVKDIPGVTNMVDAGALLGDLWIEGYFSERNTALGGGP